MTMVSYLRVRFASGRRQGSEVKVLKGRESSRMPAVVGGDQIETVTQNNPGYTIRNSAENLHIRWKTFVSSFISEWLKWLFTSRFNGKRFNGHFHLRFSAQMQLKWHIFLKERWKVNCLQQVGRKEKSWWKENQPCTRRRWCCVSREI